MNILNLLSGNPDDAGLLMKNQIVGIAENRLKRPLSHFARSNIVDNQWSSTGLEMIIDTVRTIDTLELEAYLQRLHQTVW